MTAINTSEPAGGLRSTDEWEQFVGSQLRQVRLQRDLTQAELARLANISESTVKNLEAGRGSSLATVIRVVRVLDRVDWLLALTPPAPTISPLERLRVARSEAASQRRRASRGRNSG